jgi:hypothetical protein
MYLEIDLVEVPFYSIDYRSMTYLRAAPLDRSFFFEVILKWFKHMTKAHEDRGVETLINEYGIAGYGLYFYCIEIIAGTMDGDNLTFELEPDAAILARRLNMDTILVEKIMHRCIELGLFEISNNGRICCFKILKFFDANMTSNPEMRKIIRKSHEYHRSITEVSRDSHNPVTDTCDQIRLDKNRLEEKRKEKENPFPVPIRIKSFQEKWNTSKKVPEDRWNDFNRRPEDAKEIIRTL